LEEDSRKFYLKIADEMTDPQGREMFLSPADDELTHYKIIKRQYDALKTSGKWVVVLEARNIEPIDLAPPFSAGQREIGAENPLGCEREGCPALCPRDQER